MGQEGPREAHTYCLFVLIFIEQGKFNLANKLCKHAMNGSFT